MEALIVVWKLNLIDHMHNWKSVDSLPPPPQCGAPIKWTPMTPAIIFSLTLAPAHHQAALTHADLTQPGTEEEEILPPLHGPL
jgi:hypothetical protein